MDATPMDDVAESLEAILFEQLYDVITEKLDNG